MKFIVVDTETTGLGEGSKICEVAWAEIESDFNVLSEFHTIVDPEQEICCSAAGVHGIRTEHTKGFPKIEEIEFPEGEICLIGHNVGFDYNYLKDYMDVKITCDTLILARRLLPESPDHKLQTLVCYCDLQENPSHRAIYDVRSCLGLLDYMAEGSELSLEELINWSNTPVLVDVMPFGKHKGMPISKLPESYIRWLSSLDSLDIDMEYTVRRML